MLKKLASGFVLALVLNWAWEIAQNGLYLNYHQGGPVTSFVLFQAALGDAAIISILILIAQIFKLNKSLLVVLGGLIISVVLEIWALKTGRWAYNSLMPIIPVIKVGLTPTVQLAAIGYIVQRLIFRK
jgi:hypothetical protein